MSLSRPNDGSLRELSVTAIFFASSVILWVIFAYIPLQNGQPNMTALGFAFFASIGCITQLVYFIRTALKERHS